MHKIISGSNANELMLNVYKTVLEEGREDISRNGNVHCINNAIVELKDPMSRHLWLSGRKSNIFAQIAETLWVMAGYECIDPFLSFFLPRAKDFSDDGITWRGAYGPRIWAYGQLQDAVKAFSEEGMDTRRAVVQILLPERDSKESLVNQDGCEHGNTKDRPCNNKLDFFTTPIRDDKCTTVGYEMNLTAFSRSGDAIWGLGNINYFEWTFLQELFTAWVANATGKNVVLGEYTHFVTNLHIYEFTAQQARDALVNEAEGFQDCSYFNDLPVIACGDPVSDHRFFINIVEILTAQIGGQRSIEETVDSLYDIFKVNNVEIYDNILWLYVTLLAMYIGRKKGDLSGWYEYSSVYNDLMQAVYHSNFRKFDMVFLDDGEEE